MSRWFRHYAGMARDDKLVRASIKSKQTIERVVWVWCAILESAAEIDDNGRYEIDHAEMARFLRCPESKLASIEDALRDLGRVYESRVAKWSGRQFQSDRSAERTKRYRDSRKGKSDGDQGTSRDADVTSQERHRDAPETETETEKNTLANANAADAAPDPERVMFDAGIRLLTQKGRTEGAARSLIGKWKKEQGTGAVIEALAAAQRQDAIEPVGFIEGRWRKHRQSGVASDRLTV